MSVIATAVKHLLAAGVTGEALVEAIAEMEADVRAEPKARSAGAIRQERYREKRRNEASQTSLTVTCDESDVSPSLSRPPNENNSNPPTHTHPEETPRARKADPFPCPAWCEPNVWADLKRNRKTKRLTNTETAHRRFVADVLAMADDDWPPGKLVEAIAAKGWGGAHDPREDTPPNDRRHPRTDLRQAASSRGERPNLCLDMVRAAEAEISAAEDREPDWQARPALRAIGTG